MVLDENLRDRQSYYNSSCGGHKCVYQILMAIHQIVVEIFHSKPQMSTSEEEPMKKPLGFVVWEPWTSVNNFTAVYLIVAKIFPSFTEMVDWQHDTDIHRAANMAKHLRMTHTLIYMQWEWEYLRYCFSTVWKLIRLMLNETQHNCHVVSWEDNTSVKPPKSQEKCVQEQVLN